MTFSAGPCAPWDPIWTCDVSAKAPEATGFAVEAATGIIWALSGRQFGTCAVTLRPCRRSCYDDAWWSAWGAPWSTTGQADTAYAGDLSYGPFGWFAMGCGSCAGECGCSDISETLLPSPVNSVTQVMIDGVALDPSAYRVDNNRLLVRTDGQRWPRCNDLAKADDQPGAWSVTAQYGKDVPTGGRLAVGELACEILRAMDGKDCRLPAGVTNIARQGVTINFPDLGELFRKGRTGLYLPDAFIASVNPYNMASRSRVYSVDRPGVRRTDT
jgi:hypothetical protein